MAGSFMDALSHPAQRQKVDGKRTDSTTSRWVVEKRTFMKGNYNRVFCVTTSGIETQMPNLQVTNKYSLAPEFHVKSVRMEKGGIKFEARPDGKRGYETSTLQTAHASGLASSLYEAFALNKGNLAKAAGTEIRLLEATYQAEKLRASQWWACTLRVTNTAIERVNTQGVTMWRMRYIDLKNPGVVMLDDPGHSAFKICGIGDRGHRIYRSPQRESLVQTLITAAAECLGVKVVVQTGGGLSGKHEKAQKEAMTEQSAMREHTPLHFFNVQRLQVPCTFWDGGRCPLGAEDGQGRFVNCAAKVRVLSLNEASIFEGGTDGKRISRHHDLRSVASIVAFEWASESRCFAIEWNDGSLPTVYLSNQRHRIIAVLLELAQAAQNAPVPVLADLTWTSRLIIGRSPSYHIAWCGAGSSEAPLETDLYEQLVNAACAVHAQVCKYRILEFEAEAANAPVVQSLAPEQVEIPKVGVGLPAMPPSRPIFNGPDNEVRLEDLVEDGAAAARVAAERARILAKQMAAATGVYANIAVNAAQEGFTKASQAVQNSDAINRMGTAITSAFTGPPPVTHIPEGHAFLMERLQEFNTNIPYSGFSKEFKDRMVHRIRDKTDRQKAYQTLEAIFCLLPPAKKPGQTRLRPDAVASKLLITALQTLQRLASCAQLQEEMVSVKCFGSVLSLLDCGCDSISSEAARLLSRFWAPTAFLYGAKPFVNKSTGEEYHLNKPEDATQVRANKAVCFEAGTRQTHVAALVESITSAASNELLALNLIEAVAALVAEPENATTGDDVQMLVKEKLAQHGAQLFTLMSTKCARARAGVMVIVRETLSISPEAARPIRDAALDKGVILDHLLIAMTSDPTGRRGAQGPSLRVVSSREFVQRLVEQHGPTQALMQRIFPAMLLAVLRKPDPGGAPLPNWAKFWSVACNEEHCLAGLIWDEGTRHQLRMRLKSEADALSRARIACDDPVWNHREFQIDYAPPVNVLKVGDVYVNYLLDNKNDDAAVSSLQDPRTFFEKLYFHFIFALAGVQPSQGTATEQTQLHREQELCVRAMSAVYTEHAAVIGPFPCLPYLVSMLDETRSSPLREHLLNLVLALLAPRAADRTDAAAPKAAAAATANGREFMHCGGIALLVEVAAMAHMASQSRALGAGGVTLLMDHAHSEEEAIESWWYYTGDLPPGLEPHGEEAPGIGLPECQGPVAFKALLEKLRTGTLPESTPVWAAGMPTPTPAASVRQVRWSLSKLSGTTSWSAIARTACSALLALVVHTPAFDSQGKRVLVPLPAAIQHLSHASTLPHVAQLMLTNDPELVSASARLLLAIVSANAEVLPRLYATGVFFFALAYIGRDLEMLGQLFAATHTQQVFQGEKPPVSAPMSERSVLGLLLPESLLYQLDTYGPRAFAQQMTRQVDDPEVLWSQSMREEELLPAVHAHLGDYPLRLKDHITACYDYTPMPPMTYKALKGELWCHRYYLRKLCTPEHSNHPIVDHLIFRNELVAELRKELERKAADFSKADALQHMDLTAADVEDASAEDFVAKLTRAYRKQALRLHPDKNGGDTEPFLQMQTSYGVLLALAQGEIEEGGGPRAHRLELLLQAQCLLHRRFPDTVGEYTFPAYDLVLPMLKSTLEQDDGLTHPRTLLCLELIWLTLNACADNAPFLSDRGALPVLIGVLSRCLASLPADAPPHARPVLLITFCLHALGAMISASADSRAEVEALDSAERAEFLADVLRVARLSRATNAAAAAVDTIEALSRSPALKDALLAKGVLAHLVPCMMLFNATESAHRDGAPGGDDDDADFDVTALRTGVNAQRAEMSKRQRAALQHLDAALPDSAVAWQAAQALRRICEFESHVETEAEDFVLVPAQGAVARPEGLAQNIALALFTPYLYHCLADNHLRAFLTGLTTDSATPLLIWNAAMRTELTDVLAEHRDGPDLSHDALQALTTFAYKALQDELVVEEVYVRVFVENPKFSELGAKARPLFLGLAHFLHEAVCTGTGQAAQPFAPDANATLEASDADKMLRTHLRLAWRALAALIANPTYAPSVSTCLAIPAVLAPLTCYILKACVEGDTSGGDDGDLIGGLGGVTSRDPEVQNLLDFAAETALELLDSATRVPAAKARLNGTDASVDGATGRPLCAHILRALFCAANAPCSSVVQERALAILPTLLDVPESARIALEDGGVILLLDVIFRRPPVGASPAERKEQARKRALSIAALYPMFHQQSVYQKRAEAQIGALLPPGLLALLRTASDVDAASALVTDALDVPVDTFELVWTSDMHERTVSKLSSLASSVRAADLAGTRWMFDAEQNAIVHPELQYDLYVGGVYLKRFLDTNRVASGGKLKDPCAFLDGIMKELDAAIAVVVRLGENAAASPSRGELGEADQEEITPIELVRMLCRAAEVLLQREPSLTLHAAQQGYVEALVSRLPTLGGSETPRAAGGSVMRLLLQLALKRDSARRLAVPAPALVPAMQKCVPWSVQAAIFGLDIVRCALHDANPDKHEIVNQAILHNLIPQLLGLLEPGSAAPDDLVPPGLVSRTRASRAGDAGRSSNEHEQFDGDVIRNLAVEIVHSLRASVDHQEEVEAALEVYHDIWAKHQRHSGVINAAGANGLEPTPVAPRLKGTSAATFALPAPPSQTSRLLIKSAGDAYPAQASSAASASAKPAAASASATRASAPAQASPRAQPKPTPALQRPPASSTQHSADVTSLLGSAAPPVTNNKTNGAAAAGASASASARSIQAANSSPAQPRPAPASTAVTKQAPPPSNEDDFDPFVAAPAPAKVQGPPQPTPAPQAADPFDPFAAFASPLMATPPTPQPQPSRPQAPPKQDANLIDFDPLA